MNEIQKMFQTIINGQSAFRQEVMKRFGEVEEKIEGLGRKIDNVEKRLTVRLNRLGKQLAYVEDDTPTRDEFDNLNRRVIKLEHKATSTH